MTTYLPQKLASSFMELYNWDTKVSPEEYGKFPQSEQECLTAVIAGKKAIYSVTAYDDEESFISEWLSEYNIKVTKETASHYKVDIINFIVVQHGNERYVALLQWVFKHRDEINIHNRLYLYGIIFGYPIDEVINFVDRRINESPTTKNR